MKDIAEIPKTTFVIPIKLNYNEISAISNYIARYGPTAREINSDPQ